MASEESKTYEVGSVSDQHIDPLRVPSIFTKTNFAQGYSLHHWLQ